MARDGFENRFFSGQKLRDFDGDHFAILAGKELLRSLKLLTVILPAITPVITFMAEPSGARAPSHPAHACPLV